MNPFGKDISDVKQHDIETLVSAGTLESRYLEYKEALPGGSEADKHELLADVSAFANASGGVILFGIKESEGRPVLVVGIQDPNIDGQVLRLEEILRSGLDPRLPGVKVHPVPLANSMHAIAVAIPRSWRQPHMVSFRGSSKFYARGSAGKYIMDTNEIRASVLASEGLVSRIREMHARRCAEISTGRELIPYEDVPLVVAHLLPLSALQNPEEMDISFLERDQSMLLPLDGGVSSARYNLDGFATAFHDDTNRVVAYSQLSRSGVFETASVGIFRLIPNPPSIHSVIFEREIAQFIANGLTVYKRFGIDPPFSGHLSLFRMRGFIIAPSRERTTSHSLEYSYNKGIDRDTITFPEALIPASDPSQVPSVTKPWFDALWRAAGWPRSFNYTENGQWLMGLRERGA